MFGPSKKELLEDITRLNEVIEKNRAFYWRTQERLIAENHQLEDKIESLYSSIDKKNTQLRAMAYEHRNPSSEGSTTWKLNETGPHPLEPGNVRPRFSTITK